jgi:predicted permease
MLSDFRYAARMLGRAPVVTLAAVISLSLGIGATTVLYSWAQGVLLRPFPGTAAQEELVIVAQQARDGEYRGVSHPNYRDLRDLEVFDGVLAQDLFAASLSTIEGEEQARRVWGGVVSGNYFDVLGVAAAHGRTFSPDEDEIPMAHPVVVVSHDAWQRLFGGRPDLVGSTLTLNRTPFEVIGIAPPTFWGSFTGLAIDVWVPAMMQPAIHQADRLASRDVAWMQVIGRLRPGYTLDEAQAAAAVAARRIAQHHPGVLVGETFAVLPPKRAPWGAAQIIGPVVLVVGAFVVLVLLATCANIAGLLLSRAVARRREVAVRQALGASRWRLARQWLAESLLLAALGGAGGLLVAHWTARALSWFVPPIGMTVRLPLEPDGRAVLVALAVTLLAGLLAGIAPAWQSARARLTGVLREEAGSLAGTRQGQRLRSALVVAQVALSLVLLVVALQFVESVRRGRHLDVGFDTSRTLLAWFDLFPVGYTPDTGQAFFRAAIERVEQLPGVERASLARNVPLSVEGASTLRIAVEGYVPGPEELVHVLHQNVTPGYFQTMGMPLVRGRDFAWSDDDRGPPVAIVNEAMAARYWRHADPLGRRLVVDGQQIEVIGIVPTVAVRRPDEPPSPQVYLPLSQRYRSAVILHVLAVDDPAALAPPVRQAIAELDTAVAVYRLYTLGEHVDFAFTPQRIGATLIGAFGVLALLLGVVGLYGVVAYATTLRTREFGLRMALGARPADILRGVLTHGVRLAIVGVGIGLILATGAGALIASQLPGIRAYEPLLLAAVVLLLVACAALASLAPARRAARLDPSAALRAE